LLNLIRLFRKVRIYLFFDIFTFVVSDNQCFYDISKAHFPKSLFDLIVNITGVFRRQNNLFFWHDLHFFIQSSLFNYFQLCDR